MQDDVLDEEIVEGVGSCSSLVAMRYLDACSDVGSSSNSSRRWRRHKAGSQAADVQVALLLYGPIILGQCNVIISSSSRLSCCCCC